MPSWKKVITSGSNAHLNQITTSGNISGSASSTGSFGHFIVDGKGDASLSVEGDISSSGNILLKQGQRISWGEATGKDYRIRGHSTGLLVYSGSNIIHNLLDQSTGNVGIGTSSPGEKLEVAGNISASGTGLFGALNINGTDYLGNPTTLSELNESTDATDDKIILWDENASTWKYMTLDNLQDSIDTTGGGGSVSGDTFATDLRIGRDSDNHIDFTTDNQIDFDVEGETAFIIKNTSDSGSIAVSGSVKIQPQVTVPALSESRLYNVTSENGAVVDDLHFGTDGLTPAFAFVTLDDDSTDTASEIAFGVGSAVTTTSHNMRVTHDSSTDGVLIHPQLSGTYKVTANLFTDDSSGGNVNYDINVGGSTVYTAMAKTHQSVDPVNRTLIYIGEITSGSSIQTTADGSSFHYDLGSSFIVERLS